MGHLFNDRIAPAVQATTDAYATVGSADPNTTSNRGALDTLTGPTGSLSIIVKNTHATAGLKCEIVASDDAGFSPSVVVDQTHPQGGGAETTLAAGAVLGYVEDHVHWGYYRVDVKSAVSSTPATVLVQAVAKG